MSGGARMLEHPYRTGAAGDQLGAFPNVPNALAHPPGFGISAFELPQAERDGVAQGARRSSARSPQPRRSLLRRSSADKPAPVYHLLIPFSLHQRLQQIPNALLATKERCASKGFSPPPRASSANPLFAPSG